MRDRSLDPRERPGGGETGRRSRRKRDPSGKAFSSEADTGSREENASIQRPRASFRFYRKKKALAGESLNGACRRTAAAAIQAPMGVQFMSGFAMSEPAINLPDVLAEVTTAFEAYEKALADNDVEALDSFFWKSPYVIRYGGGENLYGYDEIAAFRATRSPLGLARRLDKVVITTFGRDFATASTLFQRDSVPGKTGRQMQTWVRMREGWKVVAAHVSLI